MIVKSTFLVAFFASEAVAFEREATEAGLAVGCIFLAVDPLTLVINDYVAAAEVITQMVLHRWGGIVRERVADANHRDTALVIHNMQRVVLLGRVDLHNSVILEHS